MTSVLSLQRLAFPLILGQLAFALNGFVTNFFLARASTTAFHASLPGFMLAAAFSIVFIATLGYSGTMIAQRHGAGDACGARAVFGQALLLTFASAPLFLLAAPLGHYVLSVFDTEPAVLAAESDYFDILLANGFFTALAAVLAGPFTGRGKTRLVGAVTTFGFLLNMTLAPILINGRLGIPTSGVGGAGWAATIAHIAPCLILATVLLLSPKRPVRAFVRPKLRILVEILRLGLPNGVRSLIDVGGFFVFVAILAECAPATVAASTAAFAVNNIFQAFPQGIAAAQEIVTARGESSNVQAALGLSAVYVLAFALTLTFSGTSVLDLFRADDATFAPTTFHATARILVLILIIKAATESLTWILQAHLRGLGDTAAVFRLQFIASCCFWIPLFLVVRRFYPTVPAYWLTMLACSSLSAILLTRRIRTLRQDDTTGNPDGYADSSHGEPAADLG